MSSDSAEPLTHTTCLRHAGLTIEVGAEAAGILDGVRRFVGPLLTEATEVAGRTDAEVRYRVDLVHSDAAVAELARRVADDKDAVKTRANEGRRAWRLGLGAGRWAVVDTYEGTAFVIDRTARHVRVLHGTRTRWPTLQLAATVAEVLIRYLEGQGWCVFHAGAVERHGEVVAVIGDGLAGKTTLIAGLMRAGAGFIANERCFLRAEGEEVFVLTFPDVVHVGLGTARQFQSLACLLPDPHLLEHPRRRFDRRRVEGAAEAEWPRLPDKLGLLQGEFTARVGGAGPRLGGRVIGIVEPRVDLDAVAMTAIPLHGKDLDGLVRRNRLERGGDRHFPDWLALGFPPAPPPLAELGRLPAARIGYCVDSNGFRGESDPLGVVFGAVRPRS